jgi:glycosyltransferase involved in cell wall biosynthesis
MQRGWLSAIEDPASMTSRARGLDELESADRAGKMTSRHVNKRHRPVGKWRRRFLGPRAAATRAAEAFEASRDTVLFVSMSVGIGGPARSLLTVLDHLSSDLDRVLFAPHGNPAQVARHRGSIQAHEPMPWQRRFRRLSRIQAAVVLARYCRRHRRHLVAIHANGQTDLNLALLATLVSGVPVVMWAHTSRSSPTAGLLRWFWRRAGDRVRWLAVSEEAADVLSDTLKLDRKRIEIVPNPVDPHDVVAAHPDTDRTPPTVRVAYLGLASLGKGFDLLAPIMRAIDRQDIGLDLYVAPPVPETPVPLRSPWEDINAASVEYDITLPGRTSDVRRAYRAADIVLCPSRAESFGRIAVEAMMNGLPVVASDLPTFRRLVGDTGAGLLFPVDDVAGAAAAVVQLADDADLRREMGARGRSEAHRFTPENVVPLLEAAYRAG